MQRSQSFNSGSIERIMKNILSSIIDNGYIANNETHGKIHTISFLFFMEFRKVQHPVIKV
jgi:hypothetical protein